MKFCNSKLPQTMSLEFHHLDVRARRLGTALLVSSALLGLSGCVTTQGGSGAASLLKPLGIETSAITDMLSSAMRDLRRHVNVGEFAQAEAVLLKERDYFSKRLSDSSQPTPPELVTLGERIWARHQPAVEGAATRLSATQSTSDRTQWSHITRQLREARELDKRIDSDSAVALLKLGKPQRESLGGQIARVTQMARNGRSQGLALTFDEVLATGTHDGSYADGTFDASDYRTTSEFQRRATLLVATRTDKAALSAEARKLAPYLSNASQAAIDLHYVEAVKKELLADGRVTLEEMAQLSSIKTPFGTAASSLSSIVRVGYLDLTAASFKDRNIFDFEIAFKKDLPLTFAPADEGIFKTAAWPELDFIFVTDLAVAKVNREFKSRNSVKSRMLTGTRQDPNPGYVGAMSAHQQAMVEFQRASLSAAQPKACTGWGCFLIAAADAAATAATRKRVDEAASTLARTSQTLSIPVYGDYTYQSVDINTSKTVDVNYYVIDVRGRQILRNNFQVSDNARYNVAYNVRDDDPEKSSILRNLKSEGEVTTWEKRPVEVSLSALFSEKGLRNAQTTPLGGVQSFLPSLSSRNVAPANPVYASGNASGGSGSETAGSTTQVASRGQRAAPSTASAQTIADERFESVVVVQNPGSTGAGFYVTPDLVLTAYHVVKDSSLVQMTFYDGTKTFGKVVGHDIRLDLALVRAQNAGKPLKIHTGPLRLGETVEAIGHPKGFEFTITRGVISAVRRLRSVNIGSDALVEFVQTDTPISPGNSGGPLLLRDTVIGVNDWIRVDKGSQNLNFSVSYNEIKSFLDRYLSK